jgi:thiol peroxidase
MQTNGSLPVIGSRTPDFFLANSDLENVNLASYSGKRKILTILPSLHVPGSMALTQRFDQNIASLENTVVLIISADLPFIQHCFFETEVLHDVIALSTFRTPTFATDYGVQIVNGVLMGLMAPAVVVVDAKNKVIYAQLLSKLSQEPNYEAIVEALKNSDSEDAALEVIEDLSEHLNIPNVGASGDSLREHFRVDIPSTTPCYCEIVLPAPKENATTEYKNAYALATRKIQNKIDEILRQQQDTTKVVVQSKGSSNCMRLHLHDISASGCSIVNYDEEFSYFLQPPTLYRDCMIFIPDNGVAIANFKVMSKHKVEHHKVGGSHELIGIRFINMPQSTEFVISRYVQELERQRISLLRENLPQLQ